MNVFLSSGGAYFLLGFTWLSSAIGFYLYAQKLGRAVESETDGCFLGFGCVLTALVGGAVGLLAGKYPTFIFTSFFGAVGFPGFLCWLFVKKSNRKV